MILNKYFVFLPMALEKEAKSSEKAVSEKEAQRQKLVKHAQYLGGI
ncbi:hypothetical protein [Vibrio sagamiensis]|uniref:Uncharacterized protein n=1 Tax=Vibrio sagamiensis NBRC 104589 TaxID=1219064 RepID=A0A511QG49_9VIBR|nr:hypothetical protein [Vibrio sagamiensis]GEM75422.1 hypothetical protein VSA01S_15340 [Vibrio sagamiensis NBRC 104589]